ncbi:uncharacterized protein LOC143204978 isoform X1 [Rhynchophorus ferrugineus]|uniref:uncharacterized protein LOC143204978 isoform X1 n=1 Tax=Rhynchophorus ferrugineus TaxID=354439 RepID=UPI003FCDAB1A
MLAMEYGTVGVHPHKYACSTMSSETISESCGSRNNRTRTVRLVRPSHGPLPPPGLSYRHGPSLGFSIRGGREHGTGIFVSHVEIGSEAFNQGLRVGDQIIRINGFTIDDAIHKEVLQLISNHTHLTLKVRGVGMIPVKDKKTDALSWQIVTDSSSPIRESPQLGDKLGDVRINIMVAPKSKLGCGICKGPEWRPGIFIQFTKEGGIAREAGLRPGDQILYCNNIDFSDIPFNEAVNLMKSSRQLNLIVRKLAGSELFPGESSGYNSSASSVTGDQSPSWSDSKRLSIVKEENLDLEERLNHLDRYKNLMNIQKWDSWEEEPEEKPLFKPTIINLSENGSTIHNNGSEEALVEEYARYSPNSNSSQLMKISSGGSTCPPAPPGIKEDFYEALQKPLMADIQRHEEKLKQDKKHVPLAKSSSTSSFSSVTSKSSYAGSMASSVTNSSLSSAITQEIQRRSQKKVMEAQKPSIDEQLQKKKILKNVNNDKQHQHSKLMDEFKKAHQKMFKSTDTMEAEADIATIRNNDRLNNNASTELPQKISDRLSNLQDNNISETKRISLSKSSSVTPTPPPPPPPPQKDEEGAFCNTVSTPVVSQSTTNTLKGCKPKAKAPPVPTKYSVLSYNQTQAYPQPPPCPTPDYDTLSLASTTSSNITTNKISQNSKSSNGRVDMEALRLNTNLDDGLQSSPVTVQKRSLTGTLSNQFQGGKTSTLRNNRPVSVTIGEYPSMRRQPGKLDFLHNGNLDALEFRKNESLGSRLTSELTQTLNRSNLKKRTESMEDLLGESRIPTRIQSQNNGCVRISLSKALAKSTSDLTESACDHYETLPTRRTSRVTVNAGLVRGDFPSGILKGPAPETGKMLVAQKSITFGEMPTLTRDKSSPKT